MEPEGIVVTLINGAVNGPVVRSMPMNGELERTVYPRCRASLTASLSF